MSQNGRRFTAEEMQMRQNRKSDMHPHRARHEFEQEILRTQPQEKPMPTIEDAADQAVAVTMLQLNRILDALVKQGLCIDDPIKEQPELVAALVTASAAHFAIMDNDRS